MRNDTTMIRPEACRELTAADLPRVAELFRLSGWGDLPPDALARWFFANLAEPWLVMVGESAAGEIVSMLAFVPMALWQDGRPTVAARLRMSVLDPRLRRSAEYLAMLRRRARGEESDGDVDPVVQLFDAGTPRALERGMHQVVAVPHPKMARRLGVIPVPDAWAPMHRQRWGARKVELGDRPHERPTLEVDVASASPEELDELWRAALGGLAIRTAADRSGTSTRTRGPLRLDCRDRRTGALVGYAAFQDVAEDRLLDVLALDPTRMEQVIRSATAWLVSHRPETRYYTTIAHPAYDDAVRAVGGVEVDWPFDLCAWTHGETSTSLDLSTWYLTMID